MIANDLQPPSKPPSNGNPRRPNHQFDVSDIVRKANVTRNFGRVEGCQPRNPLNPVYSLPSEPAPCYPEPKFVRPTATNLDIEGSTPFVKRSHLPTQHRQLDISDIQGTQSRPRCYKRTNGYIPNSLETNDIIGSDFKTTRTTNPLEPRYIFATTPAQALESFNQQINTNTGQNRAMQWQSEPLYGEVSGSRPRRTRPGREDKNLFSLRTGDVPGASVGWDRLNHPYPRTTWHTVPKDNAEIDGARPREGPLMKTKRCVNPTDPKYDLTSYIGAGTELKNPFDVDPKMQKYLDRHNKTAAKKVSFQKAPDPDPRPATVPITKSQPTSSTAAANTITTTTDTTAQSDLSRTQPLATQTREPPKQSRASTAKSTTMAPPDVSCAADAANQKAFELRQRAIQLQAQAKPQPKQPKLNKYVSTASVTNGEYTFPGPSWSPRCEISTTQVDIAPAAKNYLPPNTGPSHLGFEYNGTYGLADAKTMFQQFNQTPTGRIKIMKTQPGARPVPQPQATKTSTIMQHTKPLSFITGKGVESLGASSCLQYNGQVFKNFNAREAYARRMADVAAVRTLPLKV